MNVKAVTKMLYDRAQADTGTGGLFDSGGALINAFNFTRAAPGTAKPFVVFEIEGGTPEQDDTFDEDQVEIQVVFGIAEDLTDAAWFASESDIANRIYELFHRWTGTLSGGWTASKMWRVSSAPLQENPYDAVWGESYRLRITKAANVPPTLE